MNVRHNDNYGFSEQKTQEDSVRENSKCHFREQNNDI